MTAPQLAPAPVFPVYGLDADWVRTRALDTFSAYRSADGDITYGVWLGHVGADGGIRVGTYSREALDRIEAAAGGDADPAELAARLAVDALVDLTLPGTADLPHPGLASTVVAHARERAGQHAIWPRVAWLVDGVTLAAPMWQFAGGWAGFTDAVLPVTIVAVGVGVGPDALRLNEVVDAELYGIDLHAPLDRRVDRDQAREWPESVLPTPNRSGWHADQLALLSPDVSDLE